MVTNRQHGSKGSRVRLSVEVIIDAAMHLASTDGLAGLSMRKLAGHLGVEAMSLYHYVPNKAALQVLMADRSAAAVLGEVDPGDWPEQVVELLMRTYQAGVDNPALLEVLAAEPLRQQELPAGEPDAGAAVISLLEQILTLLRQASLPDPQLAHTYRGLISLVIGFIVVQVNGLPLTGEAAHTNPATDSSRLSALEPTLRNSDPAEGVRFNLELLLTGLVRRSPEPRR